MNEALHKAIEERITLGHTKEEIVHELKEIGYPVDVAHDSYEKVLDVVRSVKTTAEPSIPPPTPTTVEPDNGHQTSVEAPEQNPDVHPDPHEPVAPTPQTPSESLASTATNASALPAKPNLMVLGAIVIVCLILVAGFIFGVMSGAFGKITSSLTGGGVPYATESELIEAIISHNNTAQSYGVNLDYRLFVEERADDTQAFNQEALPREMRDGFNESIDQVFAMGLIPAEVDLKFAMSGLVDSHNTDQPEFDLSANFSLLAEPIILRGAGSARMVDGVLYAKIDDLPANFKSFLPVGLPVETWIEMGSTGDYSLPTPSTMPLPAKQVWDNLPTLVQAVLTEQLVTLTAGPLLAYGESYDFLSAQAAQLSATPLLDASVSPDEAQLLRRSAELLQQYPPFIFVGTVDRATWNDESVYQYALDLDADNLEAYITQIIAEYEEITGAAMPLGETEVRAGFGVTGPLIEEFNRLTDIKYYIRSDGTVAGASLDTVFTFDHESVEQQFGFQFAVSFTRQDDGMNILLPSDIHEKTFEEIMQSQPNQLPDILVPTVPGLPTDDDDSSVKRPLLNSRSSAEISYNQNNFTYATVCEDRNIQELLLGITKNNYPPTSNMRVLFGGSSQSGVVVCNDQANAYAIAAPLISDKSTMWCVDSTGFSGEVDLNALSSGTDMRCEG